MNKPPLFFLSVIILSAAVGPASSKVSLDSAGPFLILASTRAAAAYGAAIAEAKQLHAGAGYREFLPDDLAALAAALKADPPRYALVFLLPDEIDVNFGWRWLAMATQLDADPFVDMRSGIITGESPSAASGFINRIARFARGETTMPMRTVDNLGPNMTAPEGSCAVARGSFMIPVYADSTEMTTVSHGLQGFGAEQLELMSGQGFVHYGGHGYPDRVVDSLNGPWVRKIRFAPSVFFNGACYTGVPGVWYDVSGPRLAKRTVIPGESFCLGVLASGPVAYFAALHPDHGIPVYQEMEYLAFTGAPLGEVLKSTHDGVVLGSGGRLPAFEELQDGRPRPDWTPAEVMLKGTAARLLYGDPSLRVVPPFTGPPFDVACTAVGPSLQVTATIKNLKLKSTFTETYDNEMSRTRQFNDRALVTCRLPDGWTAVSSVTGITATAGGRAVTSRLVGFGVEQDGGVNRLHTLIDLPSTGYQDGPFRRAGAKVTFIVGRTARGADGDEAARRAPRMPGR